MDNTVKRIQEILLDIFGNELDSILLNKYCITIYLKDDILPIKYTTHEDKAFVTNTNAIEDTELRTLFNKYKENYYGNKG